MDKITIRFFEEYPVYLNLDEGDDLHCSFEYKLQEYGQIAVIEPFDGMESVLELTFDFKHKDSVSEIFNDPPEHRLAVLKEYRHLLFAPEQIEYLEALYED